MSAIEGGIYYEYFKYTKQHIEQYGERTVVLLQVGAFFEVYGIKDSITADITDSSISEFADVCQLNISDKTQQYRSGTIVMAGFRDFTIDKYLDKLIDAGYTVPVYVQEKNGKTITRVLDKVYSAGTYMSCETDSSPRISNNIMCIWLDTFKPMSRRKQTVSGIRDTIVYGVSMINIYTGKTTMFQHETTFYMNVSTFDELERYVSVFSPSEVVFISPFDQPDVRTIIQFIGLQTENIHVLDLSDIKVDRCTSEKYISEIITSFYGDETYDICSEFRSNVMATQSLCYLLNFIQEHNTSLVKNIAMPDFSNTSSRMILANHTLSQLNIVSDANSDSLVENRRLSSVLSFLNRCCSPMGRRKFQQQLTSPTFDVDWLNGEYAITKHLLCDSKYDLVDFFRKMLSQMRDVDKLSRQLVLRKLFPSSVFHLYTSLQKIQQVNTCLAEDPTLCKYLCDDFTIPQTEDEYMYIERITNEAIHYIGSKLVIDNCKSISSLTSFPENIICKGVSDELDKAVAKYNLAQSQFTEIRRNLNDIIDPSSSDMEYVRVHETDKSGVSLQITIKRSQLLKNAAEKEYFKENPIIIKTNDGSEITFMLGDVKFVRSTASNYAIEFPTLTEICKTLLYYKNTLNQLIAKTYTMVLGDIEANYLSTFERISQYSSRLDVIQSKAYIAKKYKYCCPEICEEKETSFVEAHEIRHCLIEQLQTNELYVVNDVSFGPDSQSGVLLYGTNAVGKTSLIRAIGVSLIMAQSGMYVPCTSFQYKPYTAIFSRILGNDNIFKGLSTFAVEMSELRVILKLADENSMILGDELCSGTETESALSIFVAGLTELHKKRSSFIFATHFHEIVHYDEINELDTLTTKHMSVIYDRELDSLVYDRKLKPGSGPRTYGLEVCKSLYLDQEFLDLAYKIRNKYYPDTQGTLDHKPSVYNAKKIRGMCEICKTHIGEETHHLQEQHTADKDGFIGSFHKNHKANLLTVCETCHDQIHSHNNEESGTLVRKKTTRGYRLTKNSK